MEDETQNEERGRSRKGLALLVGMATLLLLANFVVLGAAGSLWAQELQNPRAGAWILGIGALAWGVGLPGALIFWGARAFRARGKKLAAPGAVVGVGAWNGLTLGLVLALLPMGASTVAERGTFVIDGIMGQGPFGPAAVPTVQRQIRDARAVQVLGEAVELLASDSARGEALVALLTLDQTRSLRDDEAVNRGLDRLLGKWGIDLDAVRADPAGAALPEDGRALLRDVVALDPGERWSWPAILPAEPDLEVRGRDLMALTEPAGWMAKYEAGAWRLYSGDVVDHVARARPSAPDAPRVVGSAVEPAIEVGVRQALRAAAKGRYGFMTGTSAWEAGWPEALSGRAAVTQAERVRAWCSPALGEPVALQPEQVRLFTRFELGSPTSALTNAQIDGLVPQGREWLAEVLAICRPAIEARQQAEAARGLEIPDTLRARWAELEAERLFDQATLAAGPDAGLVTLTFPGEAGATQERVRSAIYEEGAWRMEWAD